MNIDIKYNIILFEIIVCENVPYSTIGNLRTLIKFIRKTKRVLSVQIIKWQTNCSLKIKDFVELM